MYLLGETNEQMTDIKKNDKDFDLIFILFDDIVSCDLSMWVTLLYKIQAWT